MTGPPDAGDRSRLSRKAVDHARNFLSALFMGLRTAQIHDPGNKAFENAVNQLANAARDLYATTGHFSIQFVEDSVFLNGTRLRFADGGYASMRTLRTILESKELGGIEMQNAPTLDGVRKLIMLFASQAKPEELPSKDELKGLMGLLGVQKFADGSRGMKVDRRVFAAQCYAKLVLALREQRERTAAQQEVDWGAGGGTPKLRAVRVVQDLIELGSDRADFVLRLASNTKGGAPWELYSVNTCLTTIALGHGLGLPRQEIIDVAAAALFHAIGAGLDAAGNASELGPKDLLTSLARLLGDAGVSRSAYTRTMIVAEMVPGATGRKKPHWYSRLMQVAARYQQLVTGFASEHRRPLHALEALGELAANASGRFDPRMVDLLINVLRAFPVGTEVILDGAQLAVVVNQAGGSRWDRPIVRVTSEPQRTLDLMVREDGRFVSRIHGTRLFLGDKLQDGTLDEVGFPPLLDQGLLRSLGMDSSVEAVPLHLAAEPAGMDEVLAALNLPDAEMDDADPPMLDDASLVSLDEAPAKSETAPPDPSLFTLDDGFAWNGDEPPLESAEATGLHVQPWSLGGAEEFGDQAESAPVASELFEAPPPSEPSGPAVPYELPELDDAGAQEDSMPLVAPIFDLQKDADDEATFNQAHKQSVEDSSDLATIPPDEPLLAPSVDVNALRRENAELKAYLAEVVQVLRSSGLPVPAPPGTTPPQQVKRPAPEPEPQRGVARRPRRPVARPPSDGGEH